MREYDEELEMWIPQGADKTIFRKTQSFEYSQECSHKLYNARTHYEVLYTDGEVFRENRDNPELLLELQAEFPEERIYDGLLCGMSTGSARSTYNGNYANVMFGQADVPSWVTLSSEEILAYKSYGLKLNRTTGEVWCKVAFNNTMVPEHDLPFYTGFVGQTYSPWGILPGEYDLYFSAFPSEVIDFCSSRSLTYPVPPSVRPWIWSAVYEEGILTRLKGYVLHGNP